MSVRTTLFLSQKTRRIFNFASGKGEEYHLSLSSLRQWWCARRTWYPPRKLLIANMNHLLERMGGNAAAETIIITDAGTLREAFAKWQEEEAEKREKTRENALISAKEASERLGVTLSTLWRWEKLKYLIPVKVGKRNNYRLGDVLAIQKGGVGDGAGV